MTLLDKGNIITFFGLLALRFISLTGAKGPRAGACVGGTGASFRIANKGDDAVKWLRKLGGVLCIAARGASAVVKRGVAFTKDRNILIIGTWSFYQRSLLSASIAK